MGWALRVTEEGAKGLFGGLGFGGSVGNFWDLLRPHRFELKVLTIVLGGPVGEPRAMAFQTFGGGGLGIVHAVFAGVKFAGAMRAQTVAADSLGGKIPFAVVAPARHR